MFSPVNDIKCVMTNPGAAFSIDSLGSSGCGRRNAAPTASRERTGLCTASRVRFAGPHETRPALDPVPRRQHRAATRCMPPVEESDYDKELVPLDEQRPNPDPARCAEAQGDEALSRYRGASSLASATASHASIGAGWRVTDSVPVTVTHFEKVTAKLLVPLGCDGVTDSGQGAGGIVEVEL